MNTFEPPHRLDRVFAPRADRRGGARFGGGATLLLLGALLCGCGADAETADPAPSSQPAPLPTVEPEPAYTVIEVDDGGSIGGTVRWTGDVPEADALPVRMHGEACGETQPSLALRVSARGRVADAVVALVDVRRGREPSPPESPLALRQSGCRFQPHVLGAVVGWPLTLTNEDPVMHNVRGRLGRRTVLDVGLPEPGATETVTLEEPGIVRVACDVGHTWQHAWLHVHEHPYFAVTDADGAFRIDGVPPGRYTLRLWHEGWRVVGTESGRPTYSSPVILSRSVSVSPRQETRVEFELSQHAAEIAGD